MRARIKIHTPSREKVNGGNMPAKKKAKKAAKKKAKK